MTSPHSASLAKSDQADPHAHAHRPTERVSLLRLSAFERLAGATAVVALLWVGVYWALH